MAIGKSDIERLIREHRLTACFECGKCTASCPLGELFGDLTFGHTPRGIIEKALVDADLITDDTIWYCLTCDVCTVGCPCQVKLRDFIEALRRLVLADGQDAHGVRCRRCGKYFLPDITLRLIQGRLGGKGEPAEFLTLCPRCRPRAFTQRLMRPVASLRGSR